MMSTIDGSQRKAARIAGVAGLLSFFTVVVTNMGLLGPLLAGATPAEIAGKIVANERLFRIAIAGELFHAVWVIVLVSALYIILKPVDQNLSLLSALGRLVYGLTWIFVALDLFTVLRLLREPVYSGAFGPDQLPVVARLYLNGYDAYYIGLLFWSLASTVSSYLLLKSRYIPRALAAVGVISSVWGVACTLAYYIFPKFADVVNLWWFDSPLALFELALSSWLLFKGLSTGDHGAPVAHRP